MERVESKGAVECLAAVAVQSSIFDCLKGKKGESARERDRAVRETGRTGWQYRRTNHDPHEKEKIL